MPRSRLCFIVLLLSYSIAAFAQRQDPHNYDLQDVNWHVGYDANERTIHGEVTNTILLKERHTESVWFDCGPLTIERAAVDGSDANWHLDGERLTINLPRTGRDGQKLRVRIEYHGAPTAGVYFVSPEHSTPARVGVVYTQGEAEDNRYWLPTYDFPDDKATAESFIEVPPGQYALSNGKLVGIDKKPDVWTYHWKIAEPISTYLISFVAGDYSEGREALGRLPVLWYVPRGTERLGVATFAGTNRMINEFNRLTGFNYPFEKFSQSAVPDFMFGGMENASCVTQTIRALHRAENEPIANSEGLVAHELAHQWFGDTVTCADWSHAWLNEGFATFLPAFWFRSSRGQDEFDHERFGTLMGAIQSQAETKRPVVSNRYEVPMDLFDGQIYGGGAARLFTLMYQVGEKPFWKGVKAYLNEYKFKNATTEDFFRVMSQTSGRDLDTFRDQFFYNSDYPSFKVSREGPNVVIRQAAPGYDLDLKLSFLGLDQVEKEIPVHIHGPETIVHAAGLEGDLAVLDYPVTAMASIGYTDRYSSQDLLRIYRLAPNAAAKEMVLARFPGVVSADDLLLVAREEKSRPVLRELLSHLDRKAVPFLVQLSRDFDRLTANEAVSAMGPFADDPQAGERLREIWTRDSNEFLRNNALAGLLRFARNEKLAEGVWVMDSQDDMFRTTVLVWLTTHDPKAARARCLQVLAGPPNEPLKKEAINQLAILKDAPGDHIVFDVLMGLAAEPSYGSRMAAISALASYGNPRAISVIEPVARTSLFFTRRAAEKAIEELRKNLHK